MSEACLEAINAASRTAPSWARVVWSQPLGLFAADARYEDNTMKGFVDSLAQLLARTCGAVLYRRNLLQDLVAVVLSPWEILEASGDECGGSRSITLILANSSRIVVNLRLFSTMAGTFKRLEVESEELSCSGSWGER